MHATSIQVPREALLLGAVPLALSAPLETNGQRRFEGVVNTGRPMSHWHWERFIIDLDSAALSGKTPGLIDHDFGRRAAVGTLRIEGGQLRVSGHLLSNAHGQEIAKDADEGFPWQMSPYVQPGSIERVDAGAEVTVNGIAHQGPLVIFRNSRFHEFSFTPVGVDTDTEARVLSRARGAEPSPTTIAIQEVSTVADKPNQSPTVEQLQAEINGLKQQLSASQAEAGQFKSRADAAEQKLSAMRAQHREHEVHELLSAKGVEFTAETANPYMSMSEEVWSAVQHEAKTLLSRDRDQTRNWQLPSAFFQPESGQGGTPMSQEGNPLIADAKRRAKAATA